MTPLESTYICVIIPIVVTAFCVDQKYRSSVLFIISGITMCLLSAYLNSFFAYLTGADLNATSIEISPIVEECMKLMPFIFYGLIFDPDEITSRNIIILVAASFALFENICFLIQAGNPDLGLLILRGVGTCPMHIVCGIIVGYGMVYVWRHSALKWIGVQALLCAAICFHAIFNLLMSGEGLYATVGYILPIFFIAFGLIAGRIYRKTSIRGSRYLESRNAGKSMPRTHSSKSE